MQVKTAVQNGYDLRGYHYWTLLDNYEWNMAYQHKFGLYKWDREDPAGKRTLRDGSKVLTELPMKYDERNFGPDERCVCTSRLQHRVSTTYCQLSEY